KMDEPGFWDEYQEMLSKVGLPSPGYDYKKAKEEWKAGNKAAAALSMAAAIASCIPEGGGPVRYGISGVRRRAVKEGVRAGEHAFELSHEARKALGRSGEKELIKETEKGLTNTGRASARAEPGMAAARKAAGSDVRVAREGAEAAAKKALISLEAAEQAAKRQGIDMRMIKLEYGGPAARGEYGFVTAAGGKTAETLGELRRAPDGRIIITLTDNGLASEKDAVETIAHEVNHIREHFKTGNILNEGAAERSAKTAGEFFRK
ncbi:MAG: hypothetical protein JW759_10095, partial [Candidatus Coatesbacteria bacterium]|nr:hypothetical protein [Candidatus Coatesbacteria bacterium]